MKRLLNATTTARFIIALSLLLGVHVPARAASLVRVDTFGSPVPYPAFDLNFDPQTRTLWGCDNADSFSLWNFNLQGTYLSSWPVTPHTSNLNSIALNSAGRHLFYWNNLTRTVTEATTSGSTISTTVLPDGYQNGIDNIEYDPITGQIVMSYRNAFTTSPAFLHVSLSTHSIVSQEPFDFAAAGLPYVNGFCLTATDYWLIGPNFGQNIDRLVRVSRSSLQVVESYNIPGSTAYSTLGVTIDPDTGRFYMNNWTTRNVDVFQLVPEPSSWSLSVVGVLALIGRRKFEQTETELTKLQSARCQRAGGVVRVSAIPLDETETP
jgi:hypothetical protein